MTVWDSISSGRFSYDLVSNFEIELKKKSYVQLGINPLIYISCALPNFDNIENGIALLKMATRDEAARKYTPEESFYDFAFESFINEDDITPIIQFLQRIHWPLNESDSNGYSLLHMAIKHKANKNAISLINRTQPGLLNAVNGIGDTPLLMALSHDDVELAERLYVVGAEIPKKIESLTLSSNSAAWVEAKIKEEMECGTRNKNENIIPLFIRNS